jgi:hypothetical protein
MLDCEEGRKEEGQTTTKRERNNKPIVIIIITFHSEKLKPKLRHIIFIISPFQSISLRNF